MDTWTSSSAAAAWWTSSARGISEVLIDQVFWNPCFSVMFFGYIGLLEMKGLRNVAGKFRNEFVTSVTGSWTVWPLAHLVNFRFVPSAQRVLYINSIQIGYNCFLSIIANRGGKEEKRTA